MSILDCDNCMMKYDESESLTSTQKVLALVLVFVGKRLLNFPGAKLSS